ncbi:MAG: tRNA (adenosine(37)-N6)-threonylcarbamoyltransferase complex dimerization subunit type 1 TsaB [Bacillota bacterium]
MKLLALDTAASRCSAALWLEGALTERDAPAERVQAENVLPMVEELLAGAGLKLQDMDAIAFGRGPGAFTGLRVAAAVAQGLAFGTGLPVVPVSNLEALAAAAHRRHGARQVLACLDARMQEVYWAAFAVDSGSLMRLTGEALGLPGEINPPPGRSWFGAGSGWGAYGGTLKARVSSLEGVDAELTATAGDIARQAEKAFKQGMALPPERAQPVYLRDKVATPKL